MDERQEGNAQRAPLNEAGDRIISNRPYYTIQYFDHDGRRVKVATRCADKDAAQQLANELEARAMKRREGTDRPDARTVGDRGAADDRGTRCRLLAATCGERQHGEPRQQTGHRSNR